MKIVGCIIIVGVLYAAAGQVSEGYEKNIHYCEILKDIFSDMKGVMMYAPSDIYAICDRYLSEKFYPFNGIFSLCTASDNNFAELFRSGINGIPYMSDELGDIVVKGMDMVYGSSREGAVSALEIMLMRIDGCLESVRRLKETKGIMYRKLSVMGGLFICILLW